MKVFVITLLCISSALAFPGHLRAADRCTSEVCQIANNCQCSSSQSPLAEGEAPQLIVVTIDEAIGKAHYEDFWSPLLSGRNNPDGNPIGATFYIPHEYTDYEKVQALYLSGYEIGVNSISKSSSQEYWRNASLQTLKDEFNGQRILMSHFANIPIEDIVGARTPMFQLEGDASIQAYTESSIIYDNSWPTYSTAMLFPYTLDYASTQSCNGGNPCPTESHPGFWVLPVTNIRGTDNNECNSLLNCFISGTAEEISNWLLGEVERTRSTTKAPIDILLSSAWLEATENGYDAFVRFLDQLATMPDVFLVNQLQVINWMKNPVTVENFATDTYERTADCSPVNCELLTTSGEIRYMMSCIGCPEVYPWVGNPMGQVDPTAPTDPPTDVTTEGTTADTTAPPTETTTPAEETTTPEATTTEGA